MSWWTREQTIVLISLYKERPCLYETKHEDYTNKYIRRKNILEICNEMKELKPDITPSAIKNKIKTLLNQLSKERAKVRKRSASGQLYKPVLWCFKELSFLYNIEHIDGGSSICLDSENSDTNLDANSSTNTTTNGITIKKLKSNAKSSEDKPIGSTTKKQLPHKQHTTSLSGSHLLSDIKKTMEIAKSLHISSQQKSKEDAFGELLALELKELKFEENYECAVKTILQRIYDVKCNERRLHYETASRNNMEANTLNRPVNEPPSKSRPPVQILTLKENNEPPTINTNDIATDCTIISNNDDVVIKLEVDE